MNATQADPRWLITYPDVNGREVSALVTEDEARDAIMRWHPTATLTDLRTGAPEPMRWCDPCGGGCTDQCDAGAGTWPERQQAEREGVSVSDLRNAAVRPLTRCHAQYSPESPECGRPMPCLTHYPDPPVRPEQPSLAAGMDRHRFGHRGLLILSLLLAVSLSACGLAPAAPSDVPAPVRAEHAKVLDSGCPIAIGLGAKGYEQPHPGQWLRASYTMAICGPNEWSTSWTVSPQPKLMDICTNSAALADKTCGDRVGKFLWIGTPGVYDVTAKAPDGMGGWLGEATLYRVVVD